RTSLLVNGVPSCHFTFRRRCQVTCIVPSWITTQLPSSKEGTRSATIGISRASESYVVRPGFVICTWRSLLRLSIGVTVLTSAPRYASRTGASARFPDALGAATCTAAGLVPTGGAHPAAAI